MKPYLFLTKKEKEEIYNAYKSCRFYVHEILKMYDISQGTYYKVIREHDLWQ